jgi:hypothetical protein
MPARRIGSAAVARFAPLFADSSRFVVTALCWHFPCEQGRHLAAVNMHGRRAHARYRVPSRWEGKLRVLRDVIVRHRSERELHVVSPTTARPGEPMTLHLLCGNEPVDFAVRVVDSRPLVLEGRLQHELRLAIEGLAGHAPAPGEMPADRTR